MSRKYEGLIVLNTKGKEGNVDEMVADLGKEIESAGAKLDEIEQLGRKEFAYESKHTDGGHFVNITFLAEPAQLDAIKEKFTLNELVHTQNYLRKD